MSKTLCGEICVSHMDIGSILDAYNKYLLVLVEVQVLVLDLSGPTSLWFCLATFFWPDSVHVCICSVVCVYFL